MDLPRLHDLNAYWASCPPVHIVTRRIAGVLGVTFDDPPRTDEQPVDKDYAGLADLLAAIPEVPR